MCAYIFFVEDIKKVIVTLCKKRKRNMIHKNKGLDICTKTKGTKKKQGEKDRETERK